MVCGGGGSPHDSGGPQPAPPPPKGKTQILPLPAHFWPWDEGSPPPTPSGTIFKGESSSVARHKVPPPLNQGYIFFFLMCAILLSLLGFSGEEDGLTHKTHPIYSLLVLLVFQFSSDELSYIFPTVAKIVHTC